MAHALGFQQKAPAAANPPADTAQNPKPSDAPPGQKEIDAAVDRSAVPLRDEIKTREDQQRAVLDRLVTLVGGYSLLIGLTAYFSLKGAREEALSQIGLSGTQLSNHLAATTEQLKLVKESAERQLGRNKEDWTEFKTRIWSELPDMRAMQDGLRSLLFDLEHIIPIEENWNDEKSYNALNPQQKQEVLISEATIAALPTLISRDAAGNLQSLARLYRTLARFYVGRYKKEHSEADAGRALAYLSRAQKIEPEHAAVYRMSGVVFLAQQRLNPSPTRPDPLLVEAEKTLRRAIAKNPNDLGAHYNLALALTRAGELQQGIDLIRGVLARLPDFPEAQKRKYIDSVVLNQACDLNAHARETKDLPAKEALLDEAVATMQQGHTLLCEQRNAAGLASMAEAIDRELAPTGDLADLSDARKDSLLLLKLPTSQAATTAANPAANVPAAPPAPPAAAPPASPPAPKI